jgi:hypothetical protein
MMHGGGKSDFAIVAVKPANKAEQRAAEKPAAEPTAAEPRAGTKGDAGEQKHVPDTESGERVTGLWLVYGKLLPSIPEVGAVCGKAACTDLCGGREATRVPTAKRDFAAVHIVAL